MIFAQPFRPRLTSRGVSLVEVLVSVVVVSVGILGNTALYFTAVQTRTLALSRMQAVNLASDMADRIRANHTAGIAYTLSAASQPPSPIVNCTDSSAGVAAVCTPAEMAAVDLFGWNSLISKTLPAKALRSIAVDTSTSPLTYTITIGWTLPSRANTKLSHSLRVQI